MDPSALIFVALAVAWAAYLIPKALQHHDEVLRSRSVDRFSHRMRVLARREPVNRRDARLVVTPARAASAPTVETKPSRTAVSPLSATARRAAVTRAARRRRNVLALVLLANAVVVGLAVAQLVTWPWATLPAGLLVAWLVACRVMVKGERRRVAVPTRTAIEVGVPAEVDATSETPVVPSVDVPAAEVPAAEVPAAVAGAWDLMPTTLPTYGSKPAAVRRTVQTIDLESTGVWSSGRNDGDSALAREAEQAERATRDAAAERRATGS